MFKRLLVIAGVLSLGGVGLVPGTAGATPSRGVTAKILFQTTVGNKDYVYREITIAPGGSTGWHFHDGTLYGVIQTGTLTHADSSCATDGVYDTGDPIVEPSGADHVHIGRNLGSTPLVLDILYVNPHGSPLSEDAPNPGCTFE